MEKMTFDKGPANISLKAKFSKALENKSFNQIWSYRFCYFG